MAGQGGATVLQLYTQAGIFIIISIIYLFLQNILLWKGYGISEKSDESSHDSWEKVCVLWRKFDFVSPP